MNKLKKMLKKHKYKTNFKISLKSLSFESNDLLI
jgi:hypothetical protein